MAIAKSSAKSTTAKSTSAKSKAPSRSSKAAKEPAEANRRRFQRRDTHIKARLEYDGSKIDGVVTNLSLQGCLFAPQVPVAVGTRVKLRLAGETKPVAATVKAVSAQGVHCLLHAGGATLSRLSTDLDDMALLMLNAGRPHEVPVKAASAKAKKA